MPVQPAAWPGRYICHWDKDDIDDARMVRIDFLALGMLSLVEECLDLCAIHRGTDIDLSRIDFEDQQVYDRIGAGRHRRGVPDRVPGPGRHPAPHQAAQPRRPDRPGLIIRPGPIVGGAVHNYVEGRSNPDSPNLVPHDCVREVLGETFGVVLFQEQVVQVAVAMGNFTDGMAETFRRAMGRKDWGEEIDSYREKFLAGAEEKWGPLDVAERTFESLAGFAQFGFPKSHAAAFGLLAYQTTWLWSTTPPSSSVPCSTTGPWASTRPTCSPTTPGGTSRGPATRDQRQPGALHRGEHRGAGRGAPRACVRPGDGCDHAAAVVDERTGAAPTGRYATSRTAPVWPGRPSRTPSGSGPSTAWASGAVELLWQLWLLGLGSGRSPRNAPPAGPATGSCD